MADGDGGPATNVYLMFPGGVAVDGLGCVYFSDRHNHSIRRISPEGIITTVAGGGAQGDGAPATEANLNEPSDVVVDAAGHLYIADRRNYRIRKVSAGGPALEIENVQMAQAGNYEVVVSSRWGSVTSSVVALTVLGPPEIAEQPKTHGVFEGSDTRFSVSALGTAPLSYQWHLGLARLEGETNRVLELENVSASDAGEYRVEVANALGAVSSFGATLWVGPPPVITAEPLDQAVVAGGAAEFAVAVSGEGPLSYQWRFNGANLSGIITAVAGNGVEGFSGDGGPATNASLFSSGAVAMDQLGNLYIGDHSNHRIRKVSPEGIITTFAGNGVQGFSGDHGPAANATIGGALDLTVDRWGNLFFVDSRNGRVRKVDTNGIITTVAGRGTTGFDGDGVSATNTVFSPRAITLDSAGNMFIAEFSRNRVRKVGTNGIVSTVAGHGQEGFSGDFGPATSASLALPIDLALDSAGNLYIADWDNNRIRKVDTNGIITTVAGGGGGTFKDGVPATRAVLSHPSGVAIDRAGNLLIAEPSHFRVRRVGNDGIITTVAGNGLSEFFGSDGRFATQAGLESPTSVAVDHADNFFIGSHYPAIRKVSVPGPVLRFGNLTGADTGNYDVVVSGPFGSITSRVGRLSVLLPPVIEKQPESHVKPVGSSARFLPSASGTEPLSFQWHFNGIALANETNQLLELDALQLKDTGEYRLVVTNLYGAATSSVATLAVGFPPSITLEPSGQVVLPGHETILRAEAAGTGPLTFRWQFNGTNLANARLVAGGAWDLPAADDVPATNTMLQLPMGLAVDRSGNLLIADRNNYRICRVGADGMIRRVAGTGDSFDPGFSGDGGQATNATLDYPLDVEADRWGNIYIADSGHTRVRKVDPNGIITTVAGTGAPESSADGGTATDSSLIHPVGVAADLEGNLFIVDRDDHRIRKVNSEGIISTIAGTGTPGFSGDGGLAIHAELNYPRGVAVHSNGVLYIADGSNYRIRRVDTNGVISTVAGNGWQGFSDSFGPATNASIFLPTSVALDRTGNVFFTDYHYNIGMASMSFGRSFGGHSIRKLSPDGMLSMLTRGAMDGGPGTDEWQLSGPEGLAVDQEGNVFVSDTQNGRVFQIIEHDPALRLRNIQPEQAGTYALVVTSPFGEAISRPAEVILAGQLRARRAGGQLRLEMNGTPGQAYTLQASENLLPPLQWQPVATSAADPDGLWQAMEAIGSSAGARFYRVIAQ